MKKYYITIFIIAVIIFLASPLMGVKTVTVTGNKKFNEDEILSMAGYKEDVNIFAFSKKRALENFSQNTYIKSVEISKDILERNLNINLTERTLSGYVKFNENNYLYIDKEGMVMECLTYYTESRPIIEGLEFSEFTVGDYLVVENASAFDTMVLLSHLFEKFEIEQDIVRVDLTNGEDIHFFYGNIDILLGDSSNLDLKIGAIKEILPKIDEQKETGGFLYVQNVDNMYLNLLS